MYNLNPARALASPSSQARFPAALLRGLASTKKIKDGSMIGFAELKVPRSSASRRVNPARALTSEKASIYLS